MDASRRAASLILGLALLGGAVGLLTPKLWPGRRPDAAVATRAAGRPAWSSGLDEAPPEVREFLGRVLERVPRRGDGVAGYRFDHWARADKPTREAVGLKAIPGVDPEAFLARVMDVDGYAGPIAHVEASRSVRDPADAPPGRVRVYQVLSIPGVARVQQVLVVADAGTVHGYRVAYWSLLREPTRALDPKAGVRGEFNVGAWLVAPGVVGYALSSWPIREDVNALQWVSLTTGADALAKKVVEGNIDGMAAWAKARAGDGRR